MRGCLLLLCLAACGALDHAPPYYGDAWDPPTLTSLSAPGELGNLGGGEVTLTGSGFGTDADGVVVVFGDHNALVLALTDATLTVRVPPGPITGGTVDVRVATSTGFASLDGGYTYDVGDGAEDEKAYVQVNNYWESCLGGLSSRLDDTYASIQDVCETVAYVGYAGINGRSEGLTFPYPRVHAAYNGWFGGADMGADSWIVERPGTLNGPAGIDDLHEDLGEVVLHNARWLEADGSSGEPWCVDLSAIAAYRYGGGEDGALAPTTVYPAAVVGGGRDATCGEGERAYDLAELHMCTADDAEGVPTHVYEADWPVAENFFSSGGRNPKPVEVTLDLPDVGLVGQPLALPESLVLFGDQGFADAGDPQATGDLWSLYGLGGCFDDDGNGERLDDIALSLSWSPSAFTPTAPGTGAVLDEHTYVRATLTQVAYNWLGPIAYPLRASVLVEDDVGTGRGDDVANLDVPASILYQFPTIRFPSSTSRVSSLLEPGVNNWGFMVLEVQRITEYTLARPGGGTLILSYVTGDMGLFDWTNPKDADGCHNCLDDDGDGWADAEDPECGAATGEEGGVPGATACNDGADNDGDEKVDREDPDCTNALDEDEGS